MLDEKSPATIRVTSTDDARDIYAVFVRVETGLGSVSVERAEERGNFDELSLRVMYSDTSYYSSTVPLMFAVRYSLADEAWHSALDYANLTIMGIKAN